MTFLFSNSFFNFSRSKLNEHYEGLLKYKFLHQTTDNSVPVTAIFFTNAVINTTLPSFLLGGPTPTFEALQAPPSPAEQEGFTNAQWLDDSYR